ncbi:DUF2339 domain-containing protein [Defluviimonas sp. SAOS-178_SWC]|uniref:DUF2339 domain-containing protein n=1 Tax=Defluviimonas sp. SAOS-178_SWC TaxID=3121287 RepID=UPI003221783E
MDGWELLGVIAALAVLAIPVLLVVALMTVSGLKRRVSTLEREVKAQASVLRSLQSRPSATPVDTSSLPEVVPDLPSRVAEPAEESKPERPTLPESNQPDDVTLAGPWSSPSPEQPSRPVATRQTARVSALGEWLKTNWVYAVSAISLALAGIFFVQYGIETGLLSPAARVGAAILFGVLLIGAGEVIRRRWGDREGDPTAYLPSTFSGAGLVSIFGGIVAARQLYGLIDPGTALAGLVATALLAIVLGWFYGPFLAAVGLIGASVAPFIVGGESEAPYWLYAYFAVVAGIGLFVDTIRRWAWVSVLAVTLGIAGGRLVFVGADGAGWFALMLAAIVFLAVCVPARGLLPDHAGAMAVEMLRRNRGERPIFPTGLAAGTVGVVSLLLLFLETDTGAESLLVYLCLAALTLALTIWAGSARALSDLTALPAAAFLVRLGIEGLEYGPLAQEFAAGSIALRAPETAPPMTVTLIMAIAVLMSLGAAWASGGAGRLKPFWAAGAALVAPLAALVLELFWNPAVVVGAYGWALHVIALAALMAALAIAFARADGEDKRRAAYATLSTLSLIALALFLITTKGALTVALSALVVVAAALDRRFRLPEMGWFIQAGVIALSWRLVVDPGLIWAVDRAALWEAVASYGGAAAAMAAGLWLLGGLDRRAARVFLESAFAAYAALFANVLISRWLTKDTEGDWIVAHWALTLNALPWLILMLTQLYRLQLGGAMRWLRWGIAAVAAVVGFGGIALAVGPANPLFGLMYGDEALVWGPPVLDTLLVAYALPALLLLAGAARLGHLNRWLRRGLMAIGVALMALYAGLEIRRLWRGDDLSVPGVTQPELYSYTLALMAVGAALLYQAIARRSRPLRRAAMAVIALTIAKVFLIDISGLTGLTRVFSFLALGLSLAGLAWLNRWAADRQTTPGPNP